MPSAKVKRAIAAFEKAVKEITMGGTSREDWEILEHNYIKARAKLERLMENL